MGVGRYHRLAQERHQRDLATGAERGLWYDHQAAEHVVQFIHQHCKHVKGELRGRPIRLAPWQEHDVVRPLFGWKRLPEGMTAEEATAMSRRERLRAGVLRRYSTAYIEVGRKNGKSTMAAPMLLYLLVGDLEGGAEVYTAGTKRDQAKMVFEPAQEMVRMSPRLSRELKVHSNTISCLRLGGRLSPLSAEANKMDGLNVHGLSADELHQWPQNLWDVLTSASGSRRQSMILAITTAGTDKQSICYREREHCRRILEGVVEDDSRYALICTIDEEDDWQDPETWTKANPNLGMSHTMRYLEDKYAGAQGDPLKENAFKRYYLNVWTESETRWVASDVWRGCRGLGVIRRALDQKGATHGEARRLANGIRPLVKRETAPGGYSLGELATIRDAMRHALKGRTCYGGLDLSSSEDVTSLALVFPGDTEDDQTWIMNRYWIPGDNVGRKTLDDGLPYNGWVEHGFVETTPGNVIDYRTIRQAVLETAREYRLAEVSYDSWGATQIAPQLLDDGIRMVQFEQTVKGYSEPMKELGRLLRAQRVVHGGNPVTTWMADCVVAKMDHNERIRPVKPDRRLTANRIDGVCALLMGFSGVLRGDKPRESVYKWRGILVI